MLLILLEGALLIGMIKLIADEQLDLLPACAVSFVTSLGTGLLVGLLGTFLGILGVYLALTLVALLLGIVVSSMFGLDIIRSLVIGVGFVIIHIGLQIGLRLLVATN